MVSFSRKHLVYFQELLLEMEKNLLIVFVIVVILLKASIIIALTEKLWFFPPLSNS